MAGQSLYQRIRQAGAMQSGLRLSPQDVRQLLAETDVRERAHNDDEQAMQGELPAAAPRARRVEPADGEPEPAVGTGAADGGQGERAANVAAAGSPAAPATRGFGRS